MSETAPPQFQAKESTPSHSNSWLLQRKCACGGSSGITGSCSDCEKKKWLGQPLQRKLSINEPGDEYEREADRVAEIVMRIPDPQMGMETSLSISPFQRCACRGITGVDEVPEVVNDVLNSSGEPLHPKTRAFFEPRFGYDFSTVRVHTDAKAAQSARLVSALAYTVGKDVIFRDGAYAPNTFAGLRLLAHELSHVNQQSASFSAPVLQRDLAIEPVVKNPAQVQLTEEEIRAAIEINRRRFGDSYSLAVIRDVIGIPRFPAVSDRDLAVAVAGWQATHGIAQDGQLGSVTVSFVIEELQAENNDADAVVLMKEFPRGTFLDVDLRFCQCRSRLQREVERAAFIVSQYQICGSAPNVRFGPDVDKCVLNRLIARGEHPRVAGSTDPKTREFFINPAPGPCGPLVDHITRAHEQIHSVRIGDLRQVYRGQPGEFNREFFNPANWVRNEIEARNTDTAVAQWAMGILDRICP
jgi:Domain of unknown function (DUF4157)